MKKTYIFYAHGGYVGCEHQEEVELEFENNATEEEVYKQVCEVYDEWVNDVIDMSWWEKEV